MATINPFKKKSPPLTDQLTAKASELYATKESEASATRSFTDLAADAAARSRTAATHAEAVEKALALLTEAGVK